VTSLTLSLLPTRFAVARLPSEAPLPAWAIAGQAWSVTRTADELSIVAAEEDVPEGVVAERGWRALRVAGTLDFGLTGILASLTAPLAAARVSIFAISTYDTDLVLVREIQLEAARNALVAAGHSLSG